MGVKSFLMMTKRATSIAKSLERSVRIETQPAGVEILCCRPCLGLQSTMKASSPPKLQLTLNPIFQKSNLHRVQILLVYCQRNFALVSTVSVILVVASKRDSESPDTLFRREMEEFE